MQLSSKQQPRLIPLPVAQCLYYFAERVGDDGVPTDVQEPQRAEAVRRTRRPLRPCLCWGLPAPVLRWRLRRMRLLVAGSQGPPVRSLRFTGPAPCLPRSIPPQQLKQRPRPPAPATSGGAAAVAYSSGAANGGYAPRPQRRTVAGGNVRHHERWRGQERRADAVRRKAPSVYG